VRLRPLRWWDVARLLPTERELFGGTAWSAEAFWSELAHPDSRSYLIAEDDDGTVLGYAGLMVSGPDADLQTLAVAPSARRCGLGGRLLTRLIEQAADRGATTMLLEVRADNPAAITLYVRHGFERIAVRARYYQPGDVDALILRRRLPG
jgi:ribosomal-protein-alanine N-acetyltransferase